MRRAGALLAGLGALAILVLTLVPSPDQAPYSALTPLLCIVCGSRGGADVLLNVLLFIPMAAGLRLHGWPWRRVVVSSALLSLTVESLQYSVVTGRDASLSDLLTNTAGAAMGAALAPFLGKLLGPGRVRARRLFLGAAALWLGVLTVTAFALLPWVPPGRLWNDCTRSPGKPEVFTGTVRSVVVNHVRLPCDGEIPEGTQLRRALGRGAAELDVVAPSGDPAAGRRLIHAIRVPRGFLLVLAQDGRSATISTPTAGNHLGFSSPTLELARAFPMAQGIPVRLHASLLDRRTRISSSYAGQHQMVELALSPSHGWTTIVPWRIQPGSRFRLATAVWIGILILPAAYWAGFIRQPGLALGGMLTTLATGLGILPILTGYAPVHWSEWLGGCLGVALGWALHRFEAYLQSRCGSPSTSAYSSL